MLRQLLAAAALLSATLATAQSAPVEAPPRIVAVGDLHGDFVAWTAIAKAAGLVDARGHWAGGRTIFVQTGDIADRGPDSLSIIRQIQTLQREAPRAGGKVIALIGNHEAMIVTGDLRYVSAGEYASFTDPRSKARRDRFFVDHRVTLEADARKRDSSLSPAAIRDAFNRATPLGMVELTQAWRADGSIGKWVLANNAVAVVGGTAFVHGGISPKYASLGADEINSRVRASLRALDTGERAIINDPLGPLWYRGLITPGDAVGGLATPATPEQQLGLALKGLSATRLVVGHTPQVRGISVRFGGRLIAIDTGISSAYGGKLSYLEIIGDRVTAHDVPRPPPSSGGTTG